MPARVRETISSEMWEQVNSMYLQIQAQRGVCRSRSGLPELLRNIRLGCHLFQGITDATMSHNEAWHFVRLGQADGARRQDLPHSRREIFHAAAFGNSVGTPYDDLHWAAVLKSVSGFEMYRKKYGRISPRDIVEFLVIDREFPRAIHHCIQGADESLHAITGTPMGSFQLSVPSS